MSHPTQAKCYELLTKFKDDPKLSKLYENMKQKPKIICKSCSHDELNMRAYLINSTPNKIVLCHDKLRHFDDYKVALTHELIHSYDYTNKRYDFSTCEGLAFTEVRAAKHADCDDNYLFDFMKNTCIRNHASDSTSNLFPITGRNCVKKVFKEAMEDDSPFT